MRIALIADTFPPLRTSGAVQLRDLSRELVRQGHDVTVLVPSSSAERWMLEEFGGVHVLRLRAPETKGVGYVRRTIAEALMPFAMLWNLRRTPEGRKRWDAVVWYAPSIFLAPVAAALKKSSGCRAYLIIRDIFPDWAFDMGLLRRGLPYAFFKAVAWYQYKVADVIGVQTPGNRRYFEKWAGAKGRQLEVLQNWLADAPDSGCSLRLAATPLAGRKIFVYAGNMGVAQGMDILLTLAQRLASRSDIGFLFVGRGTDSARLAALAREKALTNVMFHDEIEPDEIPGLYAQCHVGMVALDPRHTTHNIPGKFLTYMHGGLPVLANINAGNDLVEMIRSENVGRVCDDNSLEHLALLAEELVDSLDNDPGIRERCRALYARLFSPSVAAAQIASAVGVRQAGTVGRTEEHSWT